MTQVFAIGTSGTDFNIVSLGNTHTFNLPDASGTARGLINTGAQILTGAKTFSNAPTITGFATGGIIYTDGNGKISQDTANFSYDATNKRLALGTGTAQATLHNAGSTIFESMVVANLAAG